MTTITTTEEQIDALQYAGISDWSDELLDFADTVLVSARAAFRLDPDLDLDDAAIEIADDAVPVYHQEVLEIVSSVPSLWVEEPGVIGGDGSPTPANVGAGILYDIAYRVADSELRRLVEEDDA